MLESSRASNPRAGALADFIREQSAWRLVKAREFPDDDRNRQSSAALATLADYVASLAANDRRLASLDELGLFSGTDVGDYRLFAPPDAVRHTIQRYGFDPDIDENPSAFLDEVVARSRLDARKGPTESGHQLARIYEKMQRREELTPEEHRVYIEMVVVSLLTLGWAGAKLLKAIADRIPFAQLESLIQRVAAQVEQDAGRLSPTHHDVEGREA